jgi:hypothetical protein
MIVMFEEFYMIFNKEKLPVAVFLSETLERATMMFAKLYKKPWEKCVEEDQVTVYKEKDVPEEEWVRLHQVLKKPKKEDEFVGRSEVAIIAGDVQCTAMRFARMHYLEKRAKRK